jgi:Ni,Fe-hydrogenase III large subunit
MQTIFSPRSAWSREFPRRMEPIECDEAVALVERIARDASFLHQLLNDNWICR